MEGATTRRRSSVEREREREYTMGWNDSWPASRRKLLNGGIEPPVANLTKILNQKPRFTISA